MQRTFIEVEIKKLDELNVGILEIPFATFRRLVRSQILDVGTLIRYAPSGLLAAGVTGPSKVAEIESAVSSLGLSLCKTNRNVRIADLLARSHWYTSDGSINIFARVFGVKTIGDLIEFDFRKTSQMPACIRLDKSKFYHMLSHMLDSYAAPQDVRSVTAHQSPLLLDFDSSLKRRLVGSGYLSIEDLIGAPDEDLILIDGFGPLKIQRLRDNIAEKLH